MSGQVMGMSEKDMNEMQVKMALRNKNWDELNDAEKIERMHEQVKFLQDHVNRLHTVLRDFQNHDHLDGKIVKVLCSDRMLDTGILGGTTGLNRDYF
jgi:hypothetical protein